MGKKLSSEETFTKVDTDIMRIPRNILSGDEKILLAKVIELHSLPNGCFATNASFGNMLGVSSAFVSQKVSKLKNIGFIERTVIIDSRTKQVIKRVLIPTFTWKGKEWATQEVSTEDVGQVGNNGFSDISETDRGLLEPNVADEYSSIDIELGVSAKNEIGIQRNENRVSLSEELGCAKFNGKVSTKEEIGYAVSEGEVSTKEEIGYAVSEGEVSTEHDKVIDTLIDNRKDNLTNNAKNNLINYSIYNIEDTGPDNKEKSNLESQIDALIARINFELEYESSKDSILELLFKGDYKTAGYYMNGDVRDRLIPIVEEYLTLVDQYNKGR